MTEKGKYCLIRSNVGIAMKVERASICSEECRKKRTSVGNNVEYAEVIWNYKAVNSSRLEKAA